MKINNQSNPSYQENNKLYTTTVFNEKETCKCINFSNKLAKKQQWKQCQNITYLFFPLKTVNVLDDSKCCHFVEWWVNSLIQVTRHTNYK